MASFHYTDVECPHCRETFQMTTRIEGCATYYPPIEREIALSVRATNCLRNAGIFTLEQLCTWSPQRLMKRRNLGKTTARELWDRAAERGRSLQGTRP